MGGNTESCISRGDPRRYEGVFTKSVHAHVHNVPPTAVQLYVCQLLNAKSSEDSCEKYIAPQAGRTVDEICWLVRTGRSIDHCGTSTANLGKQQTVDIEYTVVSARQQQQRGQEAR